MENNFLYKLDDFEGPLDLLLQLIARNKLNIYDIKLSVLIEQYLEQIEIMQRNDADIASEFLEMASRLIYLKTAKLLPKHEEYERLKDEFCGELIEYQTCRQIAAMLSEQTGGFDKFVRGQLQVELPKTYGLTHEKEVIFDAYISAVGRGQRKLPPPTTAFTRIVAKKIVAVSTKIVYVMRNLFKRGPQRLGKLYSSAKSRSELVATFLAVLELCKANRIAVNGEGEDAEIKLIKEKNKGGI
ncbi:MAG: segregation/condensation protein A [Clostridia bacterium]|nr:segregation/condensation protein A [Clostridia bacterium]